MAAAQRISQLGGSPDMSPKRIVIQTYHEIIRWLGDDDPTTRRLLERILGEKEETADDLSGLLGDQGES